MPLTRTGSPVELIKNDAYKEYYTESKDFLNQHKHLLKCTSCRSNLFNSVKLGKIHIHPLLLVLICEKCYNFYTSGDFSQDEDGYDKYCRWCGNGGLLYICSKCPYGFCKQCYKKNFPNMVAEMEDDDWECVVCQNKPLYKLQALVKVLLKLSATSSPVKPAPRSSKRRRKLSSSSEESIKKDKKIFKPSSSKGKKIDKKKKKSSSLNDSSNSHSEKEIDENQIPECSDEEFKKKSKEFLLMNIKNLKSTLDLGLKECSKLAPKIEESDLEKTKDIFKYSQHLDKLVVTLKGNLENVIVNYGMKSLKLKFIKRSLKNKQIKSESTKSQSKKKNLGSDASDDSNEDGDKKKTEKTEYKSIKDKEVKMFDDDDSDDMFPKNKSTPSINFDSLLEKIDSEDEFDNIKKKKSDDESNNKMLNGAEKKEKTKKNNSSDSENSEEEKKKKKKKKIYFQRRREKRKERKKG